MFVRRQFCDDIVGNWIFSSLCSPFDLDCLHREIEQVDTVVDGDSYNCGGRIAEYGGNASVESLRSLVSRYYGLGELNTYSKSWCKGAQF
jgi:hypothetical protein